MNIPQGPTSPPAAGAAPPLETDLVALALHMLSAWRVIAGMTVFGALVGLAMVWLVPARFTGKALVLIRTQSDPLGAVASNALPVAQLSASLLGSGLKDELETEMAILHSRAVAMVVVDSLRLQVRMLTPSRSAANQFIDSLRVPGRFKRTSVTLVPGRNELPVGVVYVRSTAPHTLRVRLSDREDAIDDLTERFDARKAGGDVVRVSFAARDSATAADVPNLLVATYLARRRTVDRGLNQRRFEFMVNASDSIGRELRSAAALRRSVQDATDVPAVDPAARAWLDQIVDLESKLALQQAEEAALDSALQAGDDVRRMAASPSFLRSPAVNALVSELATLETKRQAALATLPPTAPAVHAMNVARDSLLAQLGPMARTYRKSLVEQRRVLERELAAAQHRMRQLPAAGQALFLAEAKIERLALLDNGMGSQVMQARLAALTEGGDVRVIDAAVSPRRVTFPRPLPTVAISAALGLLLGLGFVLVRPSRVAGAAKARRVLHHLPVRRVSPQTVVLVGVVALVAGNVGRLPFAGLDGRASPFVLADLMLVPLWLTLIAVTARRLRRWPLDRVTWWVAAFVAAGLASLVNASQTWNLGIGELAAIAAFLVRWLLYAGWYWIVTVCLNEADDSLAAVTVVEQGLLVFAVFGIVQSALLPGFAQMIPWGGTDVQWDVQGRRLVSTMLDPNFAGILVTIALLLELARYAEQGTRSPVRAMTLGTALILTLSRSSLLAFVVGVAVLLLVQRRSHRLLGLLVIGGVALVPLASFLLAFAASFNKLGFDGSAAARLVPWSRAVLMIGDHPWFGIGFNALAAAQSAYGWRAVGGADKGLDGGLLFVTVMTGFVGLVMYLGIIAAVVRTCRHVWRNATVPTWRALAAGTAAATFALLVHSLFTNSLLLPFVMLVMWMLWGAVAVLARSVERAPAITGAPTHQARWALRTPSRIATAGAVLLCAGVIQGCDPCSGALTCTTAPTIALAGQIVEPANGAPVKGVTVRVGNVQSVTEANGRWELSFAAESTVSVVDVTVTASSHGPYTVLNVPVRPRTRGGEAQELGRWNTHPFGRFQGTLVRRGVPVSGAKVTFTPRSGAPVYAAPAAALTNSGGIFTMYVDGVNELGSAIGTLTVSHASFSRPTQLEGFSIPLAHRWDVPTPSHPFLVGGRMDYVGTARFRGTDGPAAGATITFTRTSGVELVTSPLRVTVDNSGSFKLDFNPKTDGSVNGTLQVQTADGRFRSEYRNLTFSAYDSVSARYAGLFGVGERWAYAFELWRNDLYAPAPGVRVGVRQVGGIPLSPPAQTLVTDQTGRIELRPAVLDTGSVELELTVTQPGQADRVIRNLKFRTFEGDDLRFAGVFGFGAALRYVVDIRSPDDRPLAGTTVTWTQTGGPSASPTTFTGTTGADGWVRLILIPSDAGEVVGNLRIVPPAPWTQGTVFNVSGLRLATHEDANFRFDITYRLPPP